MIYFYPVKRGRGRPGYHRIAVQGILSKGAAFVVGNKKSFSFNGWITTGISVADIIFTVVVVIRHDLAFHFPAGWLVYYLLFLRGCLLPVHLLRAGIRGASGENLSKSVFDKERTKGVLLPSLNGIVEVY